MLILIILASLIPGILAVVQYYDSLTKENESAIKENSLNSKIDSLKVDNSDLKKEIKQLLSDNVKLSSQLTETALKLHSTVIGGGDLDIEILTSRPNEFSFNFSNKGDLPINNANIVIQDMDAINQCPILRETSDKIFIQTACARNATQQYSAININPKGIFFDPNKSYNLNRNYMNYLIQIETRKKFVIYHLVYRIVNDNIDCSLRIFEKNNNKVVFISENNNPLKITDEYWDRVFTKKEIWTLD